MDISLKTLLMWSTLANYGILLLWVILITLARDWFYNFQARWFPLSREELVKCNYLLYGGYKLAILVLNLVPWAVLHFAGS